MKAPRTVSVKRALGAAWIERLLQDGNGSIEDACWPIYPGETFLLPAIHSFRLLQFESSNNLW